MSNLLYRISSRKLFIATIITIDLLFLCITGFIGYKIVEIKKKSVLGVQHVTNLDRENYDISESKDLKFFYEPQPNSVETFKEDWLEQEIKIKINSDGLNDRFDYEVEKKPGTFRILTLGDSHTYGVYVETKDNYTEVLEDLLNEKLTCDNISKFEVINLGVPGYDVRFSYERFKRRGLKYNPDLVFWLVNIWNLQHIAEYYYPRYEELLNQGLVDFDVKTQTYEIPNRIYKEIRDLYGLENVLEYQRTIFTKMSTLYLGSVVLVSYKNIPTEYSSFLRDIASQKPIYEYYDGVIDLDTHDSMRLPDRHPSAAGHKTTANDLYTYLRSTIFSVCTLD